MPTVPREPTRRRIVGTSLKMYFDLACTQNYVRDVVQLANEHPAFPMLEPSGKQALDLFVIPDFVSILPTQSLLSQSTTEFWVGAQDVFDQDAGAYTGEVSAPTLAQAGCRLVEIGHAERRKLFGETNEAVASKARALVRNHLTPLVCIGEVTPPGDDAALAVHECWEQVQPVLDALPITAPLVLAYEPVWAIGQKEPASAAHIVAVTQGLRARCRAAYPNRPDETLRMLYGGSAKPGIYDQISEGVDGLFLGRFAHDPAQFLQAVQDVYSAGREGA